MQISDLHIKTAWWKLWKIKKKKILEILHFLFYFKEMEKFFVPILVQLPPSTSLVEKHIRKKNIMVAAADKNNTKCVRTDERL